MFGSDWRKGFKKRCAAAGHPLSDRSVQQLDADRAAALTPEVVDITFKSWDKTVRKGNKGRAFPPEDIWIMDEVGVGGKHRQAPAIVPTGTKHVRRIGTNRTESLSLIE